MLTESSIIKNSTQRERQKAATRLRILAAARELYAERGFAAVRSSEVAAAAGVAHGTIFLHFATQESLLAAVVEDFGDRLCRRLHELSTKGVDLRAMLEAQVGAIGEVEDFYARLVVESFLLPKAARDSLVMIQSTVSYHISRAAEAGMAQGRIRRQPLHLLFNTWMGLVHYYLANRELFAPGDWVLARRGAELVDHYLGLVSIEPALKEERHGGGTRTRRLTGRYCYGHLGGELGLRLFELLSTRGWIDLVEGKRTVYALTPEGRTALGELGLDLDEGRKQ